MNFIIIYLLIGVIFSISGLVLKMFPPKKINGLYGYRTALSMSDQRYWEFSQTYSSKLMIAGGLIILILGFVFRFFDLNIITGVVLALALLLTKIVLLFLLTEKAIRNKFGLTKNSPDR